MNIPQLLRILLARWRILLITSLTFFALALVWVFLGPTRYYAEAQVLVDVRGPATVLMTGDPGITPQLQPDYLSTQVDVIRSNTVAAAAVERLGILRDPEAMQSYRNSGSKADPTTYFANALLDPLRVIPSESSRVITIGFKGSSPEGAAAVANAFADAYRDISVQLQRKPAKEAEENYQANVDRLGRELADAQTKLSAKRSELGVTAASDGTDAEQGKLLALSQQLASVQANQATLNQRTAGGALPDALNNPVVQNIQIEISKLEAQRKQLETFAGPNNVDYKQLTNQIDTLRRELAQQRSLVASGAANTSGQATASVHQLEGAIGAQRQRVLASQHAQGELLALQQNVDNLKTSYEALTAKQVQNSLVGSTDFSNVTVLAHANPPEKPAGLPAALLLVASVLLGALFGVGLAIAIELFDHRLREPEDVSTWLGIPSLGSVRQPTIAAGRARLLLGTTMRYLPGTSDGK